MNQDITRIAIGFDYREAIAYHVCSQSLIKNSSQALSIIPLASNLISNFSKLDDKGSNQFIISRFLTPSLVNFRGWVIYIDGDIICEEDIHELWALRDDSFAVQCVKHDYKTRYENKYFGNKNENYPRKNWSSVILWNCSHPSNRVLTPQFVSNHDGKYLHRFSWLEDEEIGNLPMKWNWLSSEYENNADAALIHYTLGTPCFRDWSDAGMAENWHKYFNEAVTGFDYQIKIG